VANHANYLVLEDRTTSPYTYALYLHLAYDSIPTALRTVGQYVARGSFIGLADDTGYSSGHHLHFQVHTNPWSYWGDSVDITFDDVAINGGRPRTTWEAATYGGDGQNYYVSGNSTGTDITPPSAGLTAPADRAVITTSTVSLQGWATDSESGLSQAHFLVNYDGAWQQAGPFFTTSPLTYNWNLCSDGVPAGPVSVSVKAWDRDGNPTSGYPGVRNFVNNATCTPPPPACTPTADQVALFAWEDYAGTCVTKGIGRYASSSMFSPLDGDEARSIKVGANVYAIAFSEEDFLGRSETFGADDPNLGDNRFNVFSISSLGVQRKTDIPSAPVPAWPPAAQNVTQGDTVTVGWQHNGSYAVDQYKGGPYKYQAEGPGGYRTSWIHDQFARLSGSLFSLGSNYWWVRARSCETDSSACWSPWWGERTVNVVAAPALPPAVSAPWSDTLEGSTTSWRMSGLWRLDGTPAHSGLHSFMYNTGGSYLNGGTPSEGNLTSPPITIPSTGYWMRFWYRYQTENNTRFWDQRWVQVSVDGQPFSDLYQITDDLPNTWLQSPPTNLAAYAGHTVRFRFNFVTLDGTLNDYAGWIIDDLAVDTSAPPACGDTHEQNPQPGQATLIPAYGQTFSGDICPNGDVDYYSFDGLAGQRVAATLTGLTALDPHISLLAEDGTSLLAENHGTGVAYELPRSGTYYIRVREWNHPSAGGASEGYTLRLVSDSDLPQVTLSTPASDGFITASNPHVAANVTDMGGVQYVEFFSHTSDWALPWVKLGEDWNGADGWSAPINPASLPETRGLAFYARAFDWGGHSGAAAAWNVGNDRTPPTTSMTALAGTQPFSFFLVRWSGSDSFSGFDRFDVQVRRDGGAWEDWMLAQSATSTQAWYYGEPGHSYGFRVRGRDLAGNQEAYPASPDTSTAIAACSTDSWEDDDTSTQATTLTPGETSGPHTFCGIQDADWYAFQATAGQWYEIETTGLGTYTDTVLEVYDDLGTKLAEADDRVAGVNKASFLPWRAPADGWYFVAVHSKDGRVAGDGVTYTFVIDPGNVFFLPLVAK